MKDKHSGKVGLSKKSAAKILFNMNMTEVRARNFWHGSGFINGKFIFTFFYFSDLDKGMVSIAQDNNHVLYGRVSIKGVPNSNPLGEFSEN
jgi:hypothetical protein